MVRGARKRKPHDHQHRKQQGKRDVLFDSAQRRDRLQDQVQVSSTRRSAYVNTLTVHDKRFTRPRIRHVHRLTDSFVRATGPRHTVSGYSTRAKKNNNRAFSSPADRRPNRKNGCNLSETFWNRRHVQVRLARQSTVTITYHAFF